MIAVANGSADGAVGGLLGQMAERWRVYLITSCVSGGVGRSVFSAVSLGMAMFRSS